MSLEGSLRDKIYELSIKNELLTEQVVFLRSALCKLDRKYRRIVCKHSKCNVKFIYLHR